MWDDYFYKITNTVNEMVYVGCTSEIDARWKRHKRDAKRHPDRPLYKAMNEFGIDKFSIHVLERWNGLESRDKREQYWIDRLNSLYPSGYNVTLAYARMWEKHGRPWEE